MSGSTGEPIGSFRDFTYEQVHTDSEILKRSGHQKVKMIRHKHECVNFDSKKETQDPDLGPD